MSVVQKRNKSDISSGLQWLAKGGSQAGGNKIAANENIPNFVII